jgi:hypothetical protein
MKTDPASKRRRRLTVLGIVTALALYGLVLVARRLEFIGGGGPEPAARGTAEGPRAPTPKIRAPEGVRIRVEVLNATARTGLARRAMMHLRDAGFDVVRTGNAGARSDSTVVIDRSGHPEWARLVARAVGGARVESRPDPSGYLDVTVLLGATYRAPPEPFYP